MDKEKALSMVNIVAPILVSIGAINWGLIGLFEYNFIEEVFSDGGSALSTSTLAKVIYILIGVSAIYTLGLIPKLMKKK